MSISSTASSAGSGRSIRRLAWCFALAALLPAQLGAQDPNLIDQGRYDIRLGDRAVGTETFAIRSQGEGFMSVGRIQLEGRGTWIRSAEFGLRTDGTYAPVRYETRGTGDAQGVKLVRTGTRIRVTISSDEGERMTELLANPSQVLLGPGIAQHYYFLIRRLSASSGAGELTALIPGEAREAPIRVVGTSDVALDLGGSSVPARRWELAIDGVSHLVWSDAANGRILRVEVPDRQWRSVRRAEG